MILFLFITSIDEVVVLLLALLLGYCLPLFSGGFNVLNCQSATHSALRLRIVRNPWPLGGLMLSVVLQIAVLYWAPLNELFHTVPIAPADLIPLVAVASRVLGALRPRRAQCARAPTPKATRRR